MNAIICGPTCDAIMQVINGTRATVPFSYKHTHTHICNKCAAADTVHMCVCVFVFTLCRPGEIKKIEIIKGISLNLFKI